MMLCALMSTLDDTSGVRWMRIFAYCRVSTTEQTTENQVLAIRKAGFDVPDNRVVSEQVSGSQAAMLRNGFKMLVEHKLEAGDQLVVLKLDRLGRGAIDVLSTLEMLTAKGIKVVSLDLPTSDLTSAEGRLMLGVFSAFAQFEKDRLIERTQEGLARAKAAGVKLGRPPAMKTYRSVQAAKARGLSQAKVVEEIGVSLATVKRHWK